MKGDTIESENSFSITTVKGLESLYDDPIEPILNKQTNHIVEPGRVFIAASPFLILATSSPDGVDCSPKGDAPGFVQVLDDKTLLIPDRPGNNRIDGMRNIIENPMVGIIFMVPGSDMTYRVNGNAEISINPSLLDLFVVNNKKPCAVIVVKVAEAFPHCTKAFVRSKLWLQGAKGAPNHIPSIGTFAADRDGGDAAYAKEIEADYQKRLKDGLY